MKTKKTSFFLRLWIAVLICFSVNPVLSQTFNPTADSYVRSGSYSGNNFGTATTLVVKTSSVSSNSRKTYIKFDLTGQGVTSVSSAIIKLYATASDNFTVGAYQTTNTWGESTVTWSNGPAQGTLINSTAVTKATGLYQWNVTAYVNNMLAAGNYVFSILLADVNSTGKDFVCNSREATSNKPQLVVVSNTVKIGQTITFAPLPSKTVGDSDYSPGATASSGLTVSYMSSNTAVATIVGGNIHIVGAGTATITASQAGDATYNAATSVPQTLSVNKANQTITFNALSTKVFGDADFGAGATASSGLTVSYVSSNTAVATIVGGNIHIVGAGTSTITASQAGNANYNAATSVPQALTVNTANQIITFNALSAKVVGDVDYSPGATASSGLTISYVSSNTAVATIVGGNIHIVGAGTSTITASQAGDANYTAATDVMQMLTVTALKLNQTITFSALSAKIVGDVDYNAGATASSGLTVSYASSNTAVATIVSGNIHIVGAGTATITASQAGDATYNAATSVPQTLTVTGGAGGPAYYIDSVSGIDTNNGTSSATPWKNITKLNSLTVAAGTQILLKAGSTWTGQQLKFSGSGTSTNSIIVDKYGTGAKPLLAGNGLVGQGVVYLYNQSYIEVNNLEITNLPSGATFFNVNGGDRRGVMVVIDNYGTANHIYLKNLDIHHIKGQLGSGETSVNGAVPKRTGGIFFTVLGSTETTSAKSRFNDVLIDSCTIYYCENTGIALDNEWNVYYPGGQNSGISADVTEYNNWYARRNTNLKISNNVIHHIGKNAMIIRMADETGLIEHNVCYETAQGTTGNTMFTARCKGTVFQYNEGYFNRGTTQTVNPGTIDGSMYDADYGSVDVIFQYSYSHDNSEGLYWGCNTRGSANNTSGVPDPGDKGCTVRYCISQNDMGDLIFFNYPSAGNEIYNNVFYIKPGISPNIIHESSKQHTYSFYNNIIYNSGTADYAFKATGQTRDISHNNFFGYHKNGTDPLLNEPADAFKTTTDPLLVNPGSATLGINTLDGYMLQTGSPCINTGKVVANNGGEDYWGNIVYTGLPDRGAHEFAGTQRIGQNTKGIKQISPSEIAKQDFVFYPNPFTSGDLYLNLEGFEKEEQISIDVLSIEGKQVFGHKCQATDWSKISFQSSLSKGVYLINIKSAKSNVTKKLIVQ
jgi:cyanophycinase-like exopeptidase